MSDHDSSSDEGAVRAEQARQPDLEADIEAARKAQSAAQAATEELRNALQTKGEQGKFGPDYAGGIAPNDLDTPEEHNQQQGLETI